MNGERQEIAPPDKKKLIYLLNFRKVIPQKTLELVEPLLNEHEFYKCMYAEALLDLKDDLGKQMLKEIVQNTKNTLSKGYCYYALGEFKNCLKEFFQIEHFFSNFIIGVCYQMGLGIEMNRKECIKYYIKSYQEGFLIPCSNIGVCYQEGIQMEQNYEKAFHYYQLSANDRFCVGLSNLANCYYFGLGVERDRKKSFEFYSKAAEEGHSHSQIYCGFFYHTGNDNVVEKNLNQAFQYYQLAANQKNPNGIFYVGWCLCEGYGCEKNNVEGMKMIKLSAKEGFDKAKEYLSELYQNSYDSSTYEMKKKILLLPKKELEFKGKIHLLTIDSERILIGCEKKLYLMDNNGDFLESFELKKKFQCFTFDQDVVIAYRDGGVGFITLNHHTPEKLIKFSQSPIYQIYKKDNDLVYINDYKISIGHYDMKKQTSSVLDTNIDVLSMKAISKHSLVISGQDIKIRFYNISTKSFYKDLEVGPFMPWLLEVTKTGLLIVYSEMYIKILDPTSFMFLNCYKSEEKLYKSITSIKDDIILSSKNQKFEYISFKNDNNFSWETKSQEFETINYYQGKLYGISNTNYLFIWNIDQYLYPLLEMYKKQYFSNLKFSFK